MNLPLFDPNKLSFGPGVIYLGVVGSEPTSDVGAVNEGMTLSHGVESMNMPQGNPDFIIKEVRTEENVTFAFTGLEWKIQNLDQYLGAGHRSGNEFRYGGDINFVETSLRLIHEMPPRPRPAGGFFQTKITIDIWRAKSDGTLAINFSSDLHNFPVIFEVLPAATDWDGNPLSQGEEYYRIELEDFLIGVSNLDFELLLGGVATVIEGAPPFNSELTIGAGAILSII